LTARPRRQHPLALLTQWQPIGALLREEEREPGAALGERPAQAPPFADFGDVPDPPAGRFQIHTYMMHHRRAGGLRSACGAVIYRGARG
jgi:hypothetical protein